MANGMTTIHQRRRSYRTFLWVVLLCFMAIAPAGRIDAGLLTHPVLVRNAKGLGISLVLLSAGVQLVYSTVNRINRVEKLMLATELDDEVSDEERVERLNRYGMRKRMYQLSNLGFILFYLAGHAYYGLRAVGMSVSASQMMGKAMRKNELAHHIADSRNSPLVRFIPKKDIPNPPFIHRSHRWYDYSASDLLEPNLRYQCYYLEHGDAPGTDTLIPDCRWHYIQAVQEFLQQSKYKITAHQLRIEAINELLEADDKEKEKNKKKSEGERDELLILNREHNEENESIRRRRSKHRAKMSEILAEMIKNERLKDHSEVFAGLLSHCWSKLNVLTGRGLEQHMYIPLGLLYQTYRAERGLREEIDIPRFNFNPHIVKLKKEYKAEAAEKLKRLDSKIEKGIAQLTSDTGLPRKDVISEIADQFSKAFSFDLFHQQFVDPKSSDETGKDYLKCPVACIAAGTVSAPLFLSFVLPKDFKRDELLVEFHRCYCVARTNELACNYHPKYQETLELCSKKIFKEYLTGLSSMGEDMNDFSWAFLRAREDAVKAFGDSAVPFLI